MPTYSYRCTECEKAFDIHQAFTDDTLTVCPNCGGVLRKIFSPVGVTFTGSGFYRNDSRSTTSSSESAGKSSTSTTSTPSAPAASPAPAPAKPAATS
ncbi:FmdB family transcriptional regulator [Glaciihabitans arcticus]|uniref:FmdB family transcriptional regulator n=1 Tax=Glaciihabitans arcticus TaxID=2668039 RepID=A0A4Q9GVD9_9MICO|nr:FmdB family zinc ribbon protein [Glaciihabitans arcticus]TBN57538.1 FmdB family transcriptional regulator [Glaciihabitans arcticus]